MPQIDFLDSIYEDLRIQYHIYLEKIYFYEEKPKTLKRNSREIMLSMDKAIDALEDAVASLYLVYDGNNKKELIEMMGMIPDNLLLKRRIEDFVLRLS